MRSGAAHRSDIHLTHELAIARRMHDRKTIAFEEGDPGWRHRFGENAVRLGQAAEQFVGYAFSLMMRKDGDTEDEESATVRTVKVDHVRLFKVRVVGEPGIDRQIRDEAYRLVQNETLMPHNEIQIIRADAHIRRKTLGLDRADSFYRLAELRS